MRMDFSSVMRSGVMRTVGPVMLSAATTCPPAPRTGAAMAASPTSSSSIASAKSSRRIRASSALSRVGSVMVCSVSAADGRGWAPGRRP